MNGKQCEACLKYEPVAYQFQEQCLSISKLQSKSTSAVSLPKISIDSKFKFEQKTFGTPGNLLISELASRVEKQEYTSSLDEPVAKKPCLMTSPSKIEENGKKETEEAQESLELSRAKSKSPNENIKSSSTSLQSFAKMSSAGSHPASGLSLLAESASRMPLTADRPNMREQLLAKAVEKKQVSN